MGMFDMKRLGNRLLMSRRDLNLDQTEIAVQSGVSNSYISDLERAKVRSVGVDVVFALANALGVSPAYLLGLSDSPLDEPMNKVLAEQSEDYVVFEVDSGEQRRLFREIIDEINTLPPASQRMVLAIIRTMRQVEQEQSHEFPPRIVGQ